jgi:Prp8 binding protein
MRELRHIDRAQGRRPGPALVARLACDILSVGGHDARELGRRDADADTAPHGPRGGDQHDGRQPARRGDPRQRLRRRLHRRTYQSPRAADANARQLWDSRQKAAIDFIATDFPVTAVALSEAGNELYSGGIDNDIRAWDLRKRAVAYSLLGHEDTVTSLRLSPDAQTLLSNSHDGTVRTWDVRPFAPADRRVRTYDGAPTGMERNLLKAAWGAKGARIAAGSGDRSVVVWEAATGKLLYKLPGHKGAVNDVDFSPSEDQISMSLLLAAINADYLEVVSGSSDRNLLLGELSR